MRTAEALECLRWGFDAMRSTPLTATHGARSVALSGDGVLTVTDTKTGQLLAVSMPGMNWIDAMKSNTPSNTKDLQAQRLRLHGLDVIEGRQGGTAFQKLVLTPPGACPCGGDVMDKPTNTPPRYNGIEGQRLAILHRLASGPATVAQLSTDCNAPDPRKPTAQTPMVP
eukprot:gene24071-30373_t